MKILLFFFTFIISLHVNLSAKDLKLLFEEKRYKECYDTALSEYKLDDVSAQNYLSQCAEKLGRDNMAIAALERILFIQTDNIEAMISLTQIYNRLDLDKQKALVTNTLDTYQLTPEQRTRLNTLSLAQRESLSTLNASISLGTGYDSNLNILAASNEEIPSAYIHFNAALSYIHDLSEKGGWFIVSNLNYLHQSNETNSYYNIDFIIANAGVGYKFSRATLTLPLYYKRLNYLQEDLVQEYGLSSKLDISISKSFILSLDALIAKREFISNSFIPSDFEMWGAGAGGLWLFERDFIYLKALYKDFSPSHNKPSIFTDKQNYSFSSGGLYNLSNTIASKINYLFRQNEYSNVFIDNTKRHDTHHALSLSINYRLSKHYKAIALYKNSANFTNYEFANYRKQLVELSMQYNY
jgi:hypothetical protein